MVIIRGKTIGFIVDKVTQVLKLAGGQINAPPQLLKIHSKNYIDGIGRVGDKLLIILNVEELVKQDELVEIDQAA